jgi:2-octaprenyl-6-methoxyphenol hydroxylase
MQLDDESFLRQAENRFGNGLGKWKKIGRRSSYPLKLTRAKRDWRPRMLILGNAAHAIHPVGAQGFNLGLRDVASLAELLAEAQSQAQSGFDFDPGKESLLKAYSEWRAPDQAETIAYTDGLARLYANQGVLAAGARHLGLLAHKLLPSMRRQLAIKAMGFRGRIPKLALGERLGGA